MKIESIKNPHLKRAIKIAGIDDMRLVTLANNYQISLPSSESKLLTVIMDYCSRLKASKQRQKDYTFHQIQSDAFLLLTAQQQSRSIEKLQDEFDRSIAATDPQDLIKLATIVDFCNENNIDLISAFEHIHEDHPHFPLQASHEQVEQYITYFKQNAIYSTVKLSPTRIYSDVGYRGVCFNLCAAKYR